MTKRKRMFMTGGPGRNVDPKVALLRRATTASSTYVGSGGLEKFGHNRPRPISLPTLETARQILRSNDDE